MIYAGKFTRQKHVVQAVNFKVKTHDNYMIVNHIRGNLILYMRAYSHPSNAAGAQTAVVQSGGWCVRPLPVAMYRLKHQAACYAIGEENHVMT